MNRMEMEKAVNYVSEGISCLESVGFSLWTLEKDFVYLEGLCSVGAL